MCCPGGLKLRTVRQDMLYQAFVILTRWGQLAETVLVWTHGIKYVTEVETTCSIFCGTVVHSDIPMVRREGAGESKHIFHARGTAACLRPF